MIDLFFWQAQRLARKSIKKSNGNTVQAVDMCDEDPDREHKDGQSEEDERARNGRGRGRGRGKGRGRGRGRRGNRDDKPGEEKENQNIIQQNVPKETKDVPEPKRKRQRKSDHGTA